MAPIFEKHRKLADTISDDLRHEALEAVRLQRCEHDHDFHAQVADIISDLTTLAAKYQGLLQELYAKPPMSEAEVTKAVHALLEQLPAGYPPATFSNTPTGYQLVIDHTIIFREASDEDAITHTEHYVQARKDSPRLPVGVIYGIYD